MARETIEVVVTPVGGTVDNVYSHRVVGTKRWRAFIDVAAFGSEPVDIRLFLRDGAKTLTETWLWQYIPPRD